MRPLARLAAALAATQGDDLAHLEAIHHDHAYLEAQALIQHARQEISLDVMVRSAGPPVRLRDVLAKHPCVLVFGSKSAATKLVAHVAMQATRRVQLLGIPFVVPARALESGEIVDEATLARFSPAGRPPLVRRALAERGALVLVDGLAEASDPAALARGIAALAERHPGNRFVVTARSRTTALRALCDFTWMEMAPPSARPVHPAHLFLGRRLPERRAALYVARIKELLDAWDPAKLPEGSVLRQLGRPAQWRVFGRVALGMHLSRAVEVSAVELYCLLRRALRVLPHGGSADLRHRARALTAEIQAYPGLVVERRPGSFAFADFACQELLVARESLREEDGEMEMFLRRSDPFWHGPIVLATALPGCDAETLVRGVVTIARDEENQSTRALFLAGQCAQAARALSETLRGTIERGLADLLPPRNDLAAHELVFAGDVAAPALLRTLTSADPLGRAYSAILLGELLYQPACEALLQMVTDETRVKESISLNMGVTPVELEKERLGMFALCALFQLAWASDTGKEAFERALARVSPRSLNSLAASLREQRLLETIDEREAPGSQERFRALAEMVLDAAMKRVGFA
jgi:hypothetical protein